MIEEFIEQVCQKTVVNSSTMAPDAGAREIEPNSSCSPHSLNHIIVPTLATVVRTAIMTARADNVDAQSLRGFVKMVESEYPHEFATTPVELSKIVTEAVALRAGVETLPTKRHGGSWMPLSRLLPS